MELLETSGPMVSSEVYDKLANQFALTEKDLENTTRGGENFFQKEVRWAKKDLVDDGKIKRVAQSGRGIWELIKSDKPADGLEPVLCSSREELEAMVGKLAPTTSIPKGQNSPEQKPTTVDAFVRDARVVRYVLDASEGSCEVCGKPSPFFKDGGVPYLEVHHVKHLSDGGSDTAKNAIAVCPNCHKELHYGANREALKMLVYSRVGRLVVE